MRSARNVGLLVLLIAVLTAGAPSVIRIRSGDTLSEIALRYHTSVSQLRALNRLQGNMIYAGETLKVPGAATARNPARNPAPRLARRSGGRTRPATVARSYLVQPGDGLIRVARKLHTTPRALQTRNHLRGRTLLLGQRLTYSVVVRLASRRTAVGSTSAAATPVARRAGVHRAVLAHRALPSKAAVRSLIRSSARRHGVPADLALALAYQESGFQQRVVSPVDAIGAMQVLPSTARSLGRMHGRSYDLLKASDNVEAGVTLIGDLLRATGSVQGALAGYYQGLGSVSRKGLLPQTRQYIKNIQLLRARFR